MSFWDDMFYLLLYGVCPPMIQVWEIHLARQKRTRKKIQCHGPLLTKKNLGLQLRLNVDCRIYNIVKCAKRSSRLEDAAAAAAALISILQTLCLFSSQRVTSYDCPEAHESRRIEQLLVQREWIDLLAK